MGTQTASKYQEPSKFGAFGGVFTPSLLTILGVIMFLRLSTVVGYGGLWNALLILLGAKTISVVTGLSVASIATNMRVRGGGAYYLISRSLGVEFGGVIAVFFYVAQAVAVSLYVVGFTEAVLSAFPGMELSFETVATITNILVFISVYIGAGWTIRIQFGILAVLMLSLLSFFIGAGRAFSPEILSANLAAQWSPDDSFFTVFALFFPAVTGIMAGVNMSGDLKDPARSIPNGTFAAIALLLGGTLYFFIARSEIQVKWGDLGAGLAFQIARNALLRLERERYHPKNWRPSILALSGGAYNRLHLADYACWFTADSGIVSIGQVIRGELEDLLDRRREAETILRKFILKEELPAFPVVVVEVDLHAAIKALLQCHGIGGIRPNTVLLGWSKGPEKSDIFREIIKTVIEMKRSLIVVATKQEQETTHIPKGSVNLWWNSSQNGQLMLLLALMLKKNRQWRDHPIRIIRPVAPRADIQNIAKEMSELLSQARIMADLVIVPTESPLDAVRQHMHPSAVIFAGFETPKGATGDIPMLDLQRIVELPGDVILVYNAGDVSLEA